MSPILPCGYSIFVTGLSLSYVRHHCKATLCYRPLLPASYFSSALIAQLIAMGHPIPVICNKMQRIPEIGRPMVKNISQGLRTDKYERSFIAHYLLFQFTPLSRGLYS